MNFYPLMLKNEHEILILKYTAFCFSTRKYSGLFWKTRVNPNPNRKRQISTELETFKVNPIATKNITDNLAEPEPCRNRLKQGYPIQYRTLTGFKEQM